MKFGVFFIALILIFPVYALQLDIAGISDSKLYSNISYLWNYSIPSCTGTNVVYSKPIVVNDTIYLNAAFSLSALYLNGTEKWHSTCYNRWWMGNPIIRDDVVYTQNWVGTFAFNATNGSLIWGINFTDTGNANVKTNVDFTPFLDNDLLWSGGGYNDGGERTTYVINITNNTLIWNSTIRANESSSPLIVNNRVFIGYRKENISLISYNASTFEELWNITLDGDVAETFISYSDAKLILGSSYDWNFGCENNLRVYALNETDGSQIWNYTINKCYTFAGTKPVIYEGKVYLNPTNFTGDYHKLYILNESNGKLIFESDVKDGNTWPSSMVIAGSKLVYAASVSTSGKVYVMDLSTNKIWGYNITTRGYQAGAFVYNKTIYIGTENEKLFAFNSSDLIKPTIKLDDYSINLTGKNVMTIANISDEELNLSSIVINVHLENGTIIKSFNLFDDGTNGDLTINDSLFSYKWNTTTVKAEVYYLDIIASDLSGNIAILKNSAIIPLKSTAIGSYTNGSLKFIGNQTTMINSTNTSTVLELNSNSDIEGTINLVQYNSNPQTTGVFGSTALNKFVEIKATDDIDGNLSWVVIKLYYTDAELLSRSIKSESSLRLYYWNTTNSTWTAYNPPEGGVNTTENYVWANTTHFSIYGAFGEEDSSSTPTSSGGGGGTGDIAISENITNTTIVNPVPITTIVPSEEIKTNETNKTGEGLAAITGAATAGNITNIGKATITASILLILIFSYIILRSRNLRRLWIRVRLRWMLRV